MRIVAENHSEELCIGCSTRSISFTLTFADNKDRDRDHVRYKETRQSPLLAYKYSRVAFAYVEPRPIEDYITVADVSRVLVVKYASLPP